MSLPIKVCIGIGALILMTTSYCVGYMVVDNNEDEEKVARIVSQQQNTPRPIPTASTASGRFEAINFTSDLRDRDDGYDWECTHKYTKGQYTEALFCAGVGDHIWQTALVLVNEGTG